MTAVEEDVDPEPAPEPEQRDGRTRSRTLAVLCVVFFLGAVGMAVLAAQLSADLDEERDGRRGAQRVAAAFAERVLTFDHTELDEQRRSLFELSTARFHDEYDRAFPGLKELIEAGETVSRGAVTDLFTGDVDDDTASVIAVVDTTTTGRGGRRTGDFYMQLDLVERDGRWLVDGFVNLNFGQAADASAPPTTAGGSTRASG